MGEVVKLPFTDLVGWGKALRRAREDAGLTLNQAAAAMEISPITLDGWEQGRKPQVQVAVAVAKFQRFREDTDFCWKTGNNLVFGVFPLRVVKELLEYSLEDTAKLFGYSKSSWAKMEANSRLVHPDVMTQIEDRVSAVWDAACDSGNRRSRVT